MADLNGLFGKLKEAAGAIADVSVDLYKKAEDKSKTLARTAKLQSEITSERVAIKKLYMSIGKEYYEMHKLFPEPELEQACAAITAAFERIDAKNAEIDELKNGNEDIDFEVSDDDCDCGCGCKGDDECAETEEVECDDDCVCEDCVEVKDDDAE